jgi:hypothetical protein
MELRRAVHQMQGVEQQRTSQEEAVSASFSSKNLLFQFKKVTFPTPVSSSSISQYISHTYRLSKPWVN